MICPASAGRAAHSAFCRPSGWSIQWRAGDRAQPTSRTLNRYSSV